MDENHNPDSDESLMTQAKTALEKADELATETVEEFKDLSKLDDNAIADIIGQGISPEMLAKMDPSQLQRFMQVMEKTKRESMPRSFYSRKQIPRAVRAMKRKLAKKARKITIRNGNGRTISSRKRMRNAV